MAKKIKAKKSLHEPAPHLVFSMTYGATAASPHVVFVRVGATKVGMCCTVLFVMSSSFTSLLLFLAHLLGDADWTAPLRSASAASARCA
jgi:hypothetical protein